MIRSIELNEKNTWNFFRIFRQYRSPQKQDWKGKKKPWFKHSDIETQAHDCRVLFLNAQITFLFHFQSRFWRTVWMKNSEKHFNCFSGWDLSFESPYVGICFLGLTKSLLQRCFSMFKSSFSHFQPCFWRTMWTKNSEKNSWYFSPWDLLVESLYWEFAAEDSQN